ncbi:MAG: nitroreductase family protein [Clostridiales bacterium]|nr:nitroreductase family protein [Clostridiales bacterium]
MGLLEVMQKRRSVRSYTGEAVAEEDLKKILQAGLLSASSRAKRPWELIVVRKKESLKRLGDCRTLGSGVIPEAGTAVVVVGNERLSDVWIEDCSIVMANMHLMADYLGYGSVWIQGRNREAKDGRSTEEFVREIAGFPPEYRLCAILAVGRAKSRPPKNELDSLRTDKIHMERY